MQPFHFLIYLAVCLVCTPCFAKFCGLTFAQTPVQLRYEDQFYARIGVERDQLMIQFGPAPTRADKFRVRSLMTLEWQQFARKYQLEERKTPMMVSEPGGKYIYLHTETMRNPELLEKFFDFLVEQEARRPLLVR